VFRTPHVVALALLSALITVGATPAPQSDTADHAAFDSLVASERAFAALSVEKGMKTAFLTYLASDGVIFRPGPVNGRDVWEKRPESQATLAWEPSFAEVAGSGDLGWTTGPWEFRPPAERKQPTGYGHFVTVWKKVGDGTWRAAVDLGISHDRPEQGLGSGVFVAGPLHPRPKGKSRSGFGVFGGVHGSGSGIGVGVRSGGPTPREEEYARAHETNSLLATERSVAFEIRTKGPAQGYAGRAADDVRFYRDGSQPTVGAEAAAPWLDKRNAAIDWKRGGAIDWKPVGQGVSESYDLGYVYGLVTTRHDASARPDTSSFLHIWRKDPRLKWKLAMDVENPFPKPQ
jgi:ketosteroid isomerase-like protein